MKFPPIKILACLVIALIAAGCGGNAYVYDANPVSELRERAEAQWDEDVRVSAAVPGRDEVEAIFGLPLYDQGIQPVWLEIENNQDSQIRYAPVSTDPEYFPPFEIAYRNRSGYSDDARVAMERHFNALTIPRYIGPGETRSGFVFTHADTGAKGFNVDLFGSSQFFQFNFLLRVPGFEPDYANVDFDSLYSQDQLEIYDNDGLYDAIKGLPCCSSNSSGTDTSGPVNIVLVGQGRDLLSALLRSYWIETAASESADAEPDFLFERKQDAIFRFENMAGDSTYELKLWLTPMLHNEERVWAGQIRHYYDRGPLVSTIDPDVDHARTFAFQSLIYGQVLRKIGWVAGPEVIPPSSFWVDLIRPPFFSDGHRVVLWISGEPQSLEDVDAVDWDEPPGQLR